MSSDCSDDGKLVIDFKEEPSEEELLGDSHSSDIDDSLSVETSDLDDLLDSDSLFDDITSSRAKEKLVSSSTSPPIPKLAKLSKITPITGPKASTNISFSSGRVSLVSSVTKTTPTLAQKSSDHVSSTSTTCGKSKLILAKKTHPLKRGGVCGIKNVKVQLSKKSPILAPADSCQTSVTTTTRGSEPLPQVSGYCEDFVFPSTPAAARQFSYSEKSQSDILPFSNFETQIKSNVCESNEKAKQSPTYDYSNGIDTSPFSTGARRGPDGSYGARVVHVRENVVPPQEIVTDFDPPADGSCSLESDDGGGGESASSTCGNLFQYQRESVVPDTQRKVVYNESMQVGGVDGQSEQSGMRRKSKIIKLNQTKVFRYIPDELPDVECPTLAARKRPPRKRRCFYRGKDCPDLLLETKRHAKDSDLRATLSTHQGNHPAFDEASATATTEPWKRATRFVAFDETFDEAEGEEEEDIEAEGEEEEFEQEGDEELEQEDYFHALSVSPLRPKLCTPTSADLRNELENNLGVIHSRESESFEDLQEQLDEHPFSSPIKSDSPQFASSSREPGQDMSGGVRSGVRQFQFKLPSIDFTSMQDPTMDAMSTSSEKSVFSVEKSQLNRFSAKRNQFDEFSAEKNLFDKFSVERNQLSKFSAEKNQFDKFSPEKSRVDNFSFTPCPQDLQYYSDQQQQQASQVQCVSIFAQRPSLLSRTNAGFTLRHLDGPSLKPFVLDHL